MPLPTPNENESKNEFISRCISVLTNMNEFKSKSQRIAVCYSQWDKQEKEKDNGNVQDNKSSN